MPLPKKLVRQFLIWMVAGIALYGAFVVYGGLSDIKDSAAALGWAGWLTLLALSIVNFALRFARWHYYLAVLGHKVPVFHNLLAFFAGFAFTTTPAKAGEAVRAFYLKPQGVPYTQSLAALFVERLVDSISIVVLASLAAFAFEKVRLPVVLFGVLFIALLPLVHSRALQEFLSRKSETMGAGKLAAAIGHLVTMLRSSAALLRSGPLYAGLALGAFANAAVALTLYVILCKLGINVDPAVAVGIFSVSILVGVASFVPGGLGSTEAVMGVLLVLAGIDTATTLTVVLLCRVVTMWFPLALGLLVVLGIELGVRKDSHSRLEGFDHQASESAKEN